MSRCKGFANITFAHFYSYSVANIFFKIQQSYTTNAYTCLYSQAQKKRTRVSLITPSVAIIRKKSANIDQNNIIHFVDNYLDN
jgi:hypothetical protein